MPGLHSSGGSSSINGTGGLGEGGGGVCATEVNAFRAICSLKPL